VIVDGSEGFERRKDAKLTVETAALRLGVKVRTDENRREVGVSTASSSKNVAEFVDTDVETQRVEILDEPFANATVCVRECESIQSVVFGCPYLAVLLERSSKSVIVNPTHGTQFLTVHKKVCRNENTRERTEAESSLSEM
jgi:hypothetical protein